jgi:hypothetical protein
MRTLTRSVFLALIITGPAAFGQQQQSAPAPPQQPAHVKPQNPRSPEGDVGSGAGDIGKGAGGAAGNVAKGTGKGAVDIVTLHPVKGAGNIGKGVGVGAKDAGVGAAKGSGKIVKGTGRGIGHIFHHPHKHDSEPPPSTH